MTIRDLKIGESGRITTVGGEGALRQHFLDMGVIPGAEVTVVKFAPMGDPVELRIHGYELTLRIDDAAKIEVEKLEKATAEPERAGKKRPSEHPYYGEPGVHHDKGTEKPLPEGHVLTFALVGNQNSGKTTLFNRLTGSNQHVGNFPGVTVDRKDGAILGHPNTSITDLPGIYSMSPYSNEELVSRDFVLKEKPDTIINIVDATNIERNLYLTMQLLEMDRPVVVALNMMDELIGNGGAIDVNAMEARLGVPVVPISAAKNEGIEELVRHAIHVAKYQEKPQRVDFCAKDAFGERIEATGTLTLKQRGDRLYFNLSASEVNFSPESDEDSVTGEMEFRGKVGKRIDERTDRKGNPYLQFSAHSTEKVGDSFESIWVRFIRFDAGRETWLQPGCRVQVKGEMSLSAYDSSLNISCKVAELSEAVKPEYNTND